MQDDRTTRDVYETMLSTIEHNTGDPQPEAMALSSLMVVQAAHGPDDPEAVRTALRAALERDELFVYVDEEGTRRVIPSDEASEERLRTAIDIQVESNAPDKDVIGRANRILAERESDAD